MTDYSSILLIAYPGQGWGLSNTADFGSLHWDETNASPKPTLEELLAKFEEMKPVEALRLLRIRRNELLKETDVYALPDFPHASEEVRSAWLAYRAALRDLTGSASPTLGPDFKLDEASVQWPVKPV